MSLFVSRFSRRGVAVTFVYGPLLLVAACHHGAVTSQRPPRATPVVPGEMGDRLVRKFPGVDLVSTRSGGFVIRIISGLADGNPLYVIDGHQMFIDPRRGINWFRPEDIVAIRVLKTPAETSVYGPRGVHGVILITTRQASRPRTFDGRIRLQRTSRAGASVT